ncbi:precorrin-3B synthase [Sulfitobacter sp. JB4-11]|uniref:precorrin-3B synthase n=1 Tax=Sulfitobacter rhodophyticola TaxID=3238304 RepID=UPI003D815063
MTSVPQIKGSCPGALRPMMSGDGLVVRVRPFGGRLRRAQADGIATLAAAHGNGRIDLSSRGNVQIRGVTEQSHGPLIEGLRRMGLIDPSAEVESRRNILVTPFWQTGEETEAFAASLCEALTSQDAPALPAKFGFAVDTGRAPVLQTASADIRLERDAGGGLILCADGAQTGKPVTTETIIPEAMALAQWFMNTRADDKRMAGLLASGAALPDEFFVPRQGQSYVPAPGRSPLGALVGLAFGQMSVETLASIAKHGGLRMTPWRMLLVENARELPGVEGLITDPADPLLRVIACTGAPRCPQGHAVTRDLARTLAPYLGADQLLHVSGCAKGCAHPKPAPLTVTATPEGLSLIRDGRADDAPQETNLTPDDIIKAL